MSIDLEITLVVKCDSEVDAAKLMDAVYSGYASELLRIATRYGQLPTMGAVSSLDTAPTQKEKQGGTADEVGDVGSSGDVDGSNVPHVSVRRVETKVGSVSKNQVASEEEEPKRKRTRGIVGRKKFGRG